MLRYVERLTREPSSVSKSDVEELRNVEWSDRAVHDIAQVTSYFNYVNRLADGLGVALEPEWSDNWPS